MPDPDKPFLGRAEWIAIGTVGGLLLFVSLAYEWDYYGWRAIVAAECAPTSAAKDAKP